MRLSFEGLTGGYGDTEVVFDLTGGIEAGQALGIFGRNGVGKTTLARLLHGTLPVRKGTIRFDGKELNGVMPHRRRALGLGYMPQTGMVFDALSVRENLYLPKNATDPAEWFELFPRLEERLDQKAGSMSGGERKILAFVRAISEDTSLIILDEPSEGVQPENIQRMEWCLKKRMEQGAAVLLIEQNLPMLLSVADRYLGLDTGRVVLDRAHDETDESELRAVLAI